MVVHVVTALACEARPIIARWRLRTLGEHGGFRLHASEEVRLVVSGIGRTAAAAAAAYLAGRFPAPRRTTAWINVGIAGHGTLAVGSALLAHRIVDAATGRSHYPPLLFRPPCRTDELITADAPPARYPESGACDMEASAFVATARRFASAEVVHCLKVVSDNPEAPARRFSAREVEELIAARMSEIAALREEVERLGAMLAGRMEDPPGYSACVARFRLSVTEQRLLRRLLQQRAATLAPLAEAPGGVPGAATDEPGAIGDTGERTAAPREGRELLRRLSQQLRQAPYRPFR